MEPLLLIQSAGLKRNVALVEAVGFVVGKSEGKGSWQREFDGSVHGDLLPGTQFDTIRPRQFS